MRSVQKLWNKDVYIYLIFYDTNEFSTLIIFVYRQHFPGTNFESDSDSFISAYNLDLTTHFNSKFVNYGKKYILTNLGGLSRGLWPILNDQADHLFYRDIGLWSHIVRTSILSWRTSYKDHFKKDYFWKEGEQGLDEKF